MVVYTCHPIYPGSANRRTRVQPQPGINSRPSQKYPKEKGWVIAEVLMS
jgi:hypothetical protein